MSYLGGKKLFVREEAIFYAMIGSAVWGRRIRKSARVSDPFDSLNFLTYHSSYISQAMTYLIPSTR